MNKKFCINIILIFILFLTSCISDDITTTTFSENIDEYGFNKLYECSDNFEIYTNEKKDGFYYYVLDDSGDYIDSGYHIGLRGNLRFEKYNNLLELEISEGGPLIRKRYYDVINGRTTQFFYNPIVQQNEMIAYFALDTKINKTVLIVRNMFDSRVYYKVIYRDFSVTSGYGGTTATFSEDGKSLEITYQTTLSDEKITEKITL